jgi:hypothetical protein
MCVLVSDVCKLSPFSYVFRRMSIRRSNQLMAHLEEAAAEEEAPQGRGHGRGRGRPPLHGGALGARARGDGALPPPPENPEAEVEQGGAERGQPKPDQPPPPPPNLVEVMVLQT